VSPGRPPKTLAAHVRDRTFIPSRHASLLDSEDLASSALPALRELQERFRTTAAQRVRRAIAVEFAQAVRVGSAGRRLTDAQTWLAQVGLIQVTFAEAGGADEFFELQEAWEAWDAEHGPRWRVLHGAALAVDLELPATAAPTTEEEWPPDPPGWHIVSNW
jgi:hypothetical protein